MPVEIKMKSVNDNGVGFFSQALKDNPLLLKRFEALTAKGVTFTITFYAVTANLSKFGKENAGVNLPVSTTALMKGTPDTQLAKSVVFMKLEELADHISALIDGTPVPEKAGPLENVTESHHGSFSSSQPNMQSIPKKVVEAEWDASVAKKPAAKSMKFMNPNTTPAPIKPGADMEALVNATELGQQVHGTSKGSHYYVVALSPRVNVACRIVGKTKISFRAEGKPSDFERLRLKECGMTPSKGESHWSVHIEQSGVPVSRIIGAYLMGLEIAFNAQITNANLSKVKPA